MPRVAVRLTPGELALLASALDPHVYWQLSDPYHRDSGCVRGKGSDDPEARAEIRRSERLLARLERIAYEASAHAG